MGNCEGHYGSLNTTIANQSSGIRMSPEYSQMLLLACGKGCFAAWKSRTSHSLSFCTHWMTEHLVMPCPFSSNSHYGKSVGTFIVLRFKGTSRNDSSCCLLSLSGWFETFFSSVEDEPSPLVMAYSLPWSVRRDTGLCYE